MYSYTIRLTYWQLLLWGCHVGHSFKNSIIFSAWLVYTYRQNILIINLFKTMWLLKNGYNSLTAASKVLGPIWFINLNKSVEMFTTYAAKQAGEFSYTTYWLHGMISNWITFGVTFRKLNRIINTAFKGQFKKLEFEWHPWLETRISWPRATFISSVSSSPWPTKECLSSGIPCLGICDTDISGHLANIPLPSNDDSLDCIIFYNTHISQYILEKKYSNTSRWFFNIRRVKRIINFFDWVFINYINSKGLFDWNKLNKLQKEKEDPIKNYKKLFTLKNINLSTFWYFGLKFFFSNNFGLYSYKEQVDVFDTYLFNVNINKIFYIYKTNSIFLSKVLSTFILKTAWKNKKYIRKNSFKLKTFKLKFLTGYYNYLSKNWRGTNNYFYQRFLTSRIYKTYLRSTRYRFNKYILKFIKFYYLKKFIHYRGFWSNYSLDLLNISNLSYITMSYCSDYFKNLLFKPIHNLSNSFNFSFNKKKLGINKKINYFKYKSNIFLNKILKSKFINKYKKFYIYFNNYTKYKKLYLKKTKLIYIYYLFFFNFYLWNTTLKKYKKSTNFLYKRLKFLKKIEKNFYLLNFYQKSVNSITKFNFLFKNNNNINIIKKYFKIFNNNYIKSFNFNNLGLNLDNIDFINLQLKKSFFNNLKTSQYNRKIFNWDKQKKFVSIKNKLWFNNAKDKILWQLYKPYKYNNFIKKSLYKKYFYYNKVFKKINNNKLKNYNIKVLKQNNNKLVNSNNYLIKNFKKKRFIQKYKYSLINDLKFQKNSKSEYYFFYLNKFNINYIKKIYLTNLYKNNNLFKMDLYNNKKLNNFLLPSIKLKNINNNIYILKNLIYNNDWVFSKKYFFYLTKKKNNNQIIKIYKLLYTIISLLYQIKRKT